MIAVSESMKSISFEKSVLKVFKDSILKLILIIFSLTLESFLLKDVSKIIGTPDKQVTKSEKSVRKKLRGS